ncbi:UNVERIFIED_CONTAM: hypothetical protein NCL1_35306 [Trichonephila clavipes]
MATGSYMTPNYSRSQIFYFASRLSSYILKLRKQILIVTLNKVILLLILQYNLLHNAGETQSFLECKDNLNNHPSKAVKFPTGVTTCYRSWLPPQLASSNSNDTQQLSAIIFNIISPPCWWSSSCSRSHRILKCVSSGLVVFRASPDVAEPSQSVTSNDLSNLRFFVKPI